ncbi:MAG: hypothetical protein H6728_15875 [Myxococcales bacterium]|nr:hypothetical protein [Myxococcales bacterium]MCB9644552.1 hypothetical protein [Myxococcales bacterium]
MKGLTGLFRRAPSDRELLKSHLTHQSVWMTAFPEEHRGQWLYWLTVGLCVCVFTGFALFHIRIHGETMRLRFALGQAQEQAQATQAERRHLEKEWAVLVAPERLMPLASRKLGLVTPKRNFIVRLPDKDMHAKGGVHLAQRSPSRQVQIR